MSTYKERIVINRGTRIALGALGILATLLCILWFIVGFRQTWFLLLVSAGTAYYCLALSIRGHQTATRDDGEP